VIDAVLRATDDPEPASRYLAGVGLARQIEGALVEMERLHRHEAERAGLG